MIARSQNFKAIPLNIVGSSTFGRYPKISIEKTYNMFISDDWLVPYPGYQIAIPSSRFNNAKEGRGCYSSEKLKRMIVVMDADVYLVNTTFNQLSDITTDSTVIFLGKLQTSTGVVYIAENNKPQIAITDGVSVYIYDPTLTPSFQTITIPDVVPGYITFHDTYFIIAAVGTNTWRLSDSNDGTSWPSTAAYVGLIETKPDNCQAVVRFPSKGNMIFVFGTTVTEAWFDTGAQLFPYQRQNQFNIDYGCLNPATIAFMDEIVVWLAVNEKSGAIVMFSQGGMPEKITTDGFDYVFAQLTAPQDSQAFIYRQDGHLIYHLNFYTDNLSLFYDFNTKKVYHACDQNLNYYIAGQVTFFNNQMYFTTKNNGNFYALDTIFTNYQDVDANGNVQIHEIPRFRTCKNLRLPSQEYFILNDVGFTIESGETNYQRQVIAPIYLITQDGKFLITQGDVINLITEDGKYLITQDGNNLISNQVNPDAFNYLIAQQPEVINITPCVDLSISYDGGATFGNEMRYELPGIGQRRNRLMWWQLGAANDAVCLFKFWGLGRFVATDGLANIRQ